MSNNKQGRTAAIAAIIACVIALIVLVTALVAFVLGDAGQGLRDAIAGIFSGGEEQHEQADFTPPPRLRETPEPLQPPTPAIQEIPQGDAIVEVEGTLSAVVTQGGWAYYCRAEDGEILVGRLSTDGTHEILIEHPWDWEWPMILGFDVTEEGDFLFFIEDWEWDDSFFDDWDEEAWENLDPEDDEAWEALWDEMSWGDESRTYLYVRYHAATETFTVIDVTETLGLDDGTAWMEGTFFDSEGNLAVTVFKEEGMAIYILGGDGALRGVIEEGWVELARTRDGRIVSAESDWDANFQNIWTFREIDMSRGDWGEPLSVLQEDGWLWEKFSAPRDALFDLFLDFRSDGGAFLYGFNMETGELTRLFNWEDRETSDSPLEWVGGITGDGSVVIYRWLDSGDRFWTELRILTH